MTTMTVFAIKSDVSHALNKCIFGFMLVLHLIDRIIGELPEADDSLLVKEWSTNETTQSLLNNTSLPLVESSWRHEKQLQTRVLAMGIALPVGLVLVLAAIYFVFEKKMHRNPWIAVHTGESGRDRVVEHILPGNESLYA